MYDGLWRTASARWYLYRDKKFIYYLTDRCTNKVRVFVGYYELYEWLREIEQVIPKFRQEVKA